jgi:hypothetical protein
MSQLHAVQDLPHPVSLSWRLPERVGTRPRWLVFFARGGPPGSLIISGELL